MLYIWYWYNRRTHQDIAHSDEFYDSWLAASLAGKHWWKLYGHPDYEDICYLKIHSCESDNWFAIANLLKKSKDA